jgi:hypothetical protein
MDIVSMVSVANFVSAAGSAGSALAAIISAKLAKKAIEENRRISHEAIALSSSTSEDVRKMFKKQYVFELHDAWTGIRLISKDSPNTGDAIKGANTLELTATVWLNDIMDRGILHQTYSEKYFTLYDSLNKVETDLQGLNKNGRELLTAPITRVHAEMRRYSDSQTYSSSLSS